MDPLSQKKFDEILQKETTTLSDSDIAFLQARRDYLTPVQKEFYSEILGIKVEEKLPVISTPVPNTSQLSYKELQRKARSLGLPFIGQKKENLLVAISTAEGPASADNPQ